MNCGDRMKFILILCLCLLVTPVFADCSGYYHSSTCTSHSGCAWHPDGGPEDPDDYCYGTEITPTPTPTSTPTPTPTLTPMETYPLETNITYWLSGSDDSEGVFAMSEMYPENATIKSNYTGTIQTTTRVQGLDLIFEGLVSMLVFSFVSMIFLGLLVWKMYFGSGGAK